MNHNYFKIFFITFFFTNVSLAQELPIDFSNATDNFTPFGGSGFSTRSNPDAGGDTVAQFFNDNNADLWQGFFIDLISAVDLDSQQTITLDFYAFDPNSHTVTVKFENGTNPDVQVTVTDSGSGWENGIVFDFSNAVLSSDGTTMVNATGTYSKLVIFIDGGINVAGTYLIDDINNGSIPTDPNAIDIEYTDLVWSDEFNTPGKTAVNSTNWFHQTQLPAGGSWFNGEEQHYTNRIENSFVENDNLNIVAIKESFTDQGETKEYTSTRLNSKFAFTYGRVDVRAKLPSGDGTWPAIWTLGKNVSESGAYWQTQGFGTTSWPACGEIDIMEHGLGDVNHTSSALHTPSSSGNTQNVASQEISDVAANWHIYSMNWSPNQITFLVDGVGYYTYNPAVKDASTWPFDLDQYIILNIAMGGIAGTIDSGFTQSPMVIDYVRVYQSTLSTDEISENRFKVFPNPANTEINIQTNINIDYVEVYDIFGKFVLRESKTVNSIKTTNLSPGLYLLNIYAEGVRVVKKVIID